MFSHISNRISEYMTMYTDLWAFSGSVAAVKEGDLLFCKAYGYANMEHKVSNTTKTKHRVWSLTKQFTAAAILIMEERGMLRVEDSVNFYFPECDNLDSRVTIHHLLTHTSGLFNYSNLPDSQKTFQRMSHNKADLLKMFSDMPLDFEPGTQFNYSNTGYFFLGMLIERLSGVSYHQFLMDNIFRPLEMYDTGVDDGKEVIENMATGYYLNGERLIHCNYIHIDLIWSSGAMYSTIEDLLVWDRALSSEGLLSGKSLEKMNTPYKSHYGYGVAVSDKGQKKLVHHDGGCEGFLAEIHRYVDNDVTIVILSNYGFTAVSKLCSVIASIVFDERVEMPTRPKPFPMSRELLDHYMGVYEGEGLKLELYDGTYGLTLRIDGEYELPVYPISDYTLHHTWIDEAYTFTKNTDGQTCLWGIKKKR